MKKLIIVITILVLLLSMSSAYALWRDSVSISVFASSAVLDMNYTGRTAGSLFTSSPSIPSSQVSETVEDLRFRFNNQATTVVYTITNNGNVDLVLDGINVLNKSITIPNNAPAGDYESTISVSYTLENSSGYYDRKVVTNFSSHNGVTFSGSPACVLAANGGQCTLTVIYYRDFTFSNWMINFQGITINKTDKLSYSVYR